MTHYVLAYYHISPQENPNEEVLKHKAFFEQRDITCRIYISETGINGQMSAPRQDALDYMNWMHSRPEFADLVFKIQTHHENVFPRKTIKYRRHLVAYDDPVDFSKRGKHISPDEWKQMLEKEQDKVLLDIRNNYEWRLGRFEGAEQPPCETFRDFSNYAEELKKRINPEKTPVMMYCTGGIRCELFSSILKEKGFEKVYQLEGGIINYGLKQGSDHWLGKLFVFDDRLAVSLSDKQSTEVIGTCHHCGVSNDVYYNCANMDCNELFLCCPECLKQFAGCCQESCKSAERVRPYHHCTHKPFRKWYHYTGYGIKKRMKDEG